MLPHQVKRLAIPKPMAWSPLLQKGDKNAGVLLFFGKAVTPEKQPYTDLGGWFGGKFGEKVKAVGRSVERGVVGLQMYRNAVLTVLQSHVYY